MLQEILPNPRFNKFILIKQKICPLNFVHGTYKFLQTSIPKNGVEN